MVLQSRQQLKKEKIPAGEILCLQGSPCLSLNILHDGQIEALSAPKSLEANPDKLIPSSRRVAISSKNSSFGAASLVLNQAYMYSYRTVSECIISTFPVSAGSFNKLIQTKLSIGFNIYKSLISELINAVNKNKKITFLNSLLCRWNDNLAISYSYFNPEVYKELNEKSTEEAGQTKHAGGIIDPILPEAKVLVHDFLENGGEIPSPFSHKFLIGDHSTVLNKHYDAHSNFEIDRINFYRRIFGINPEIQGKLYSNDINILLFILKDLAKLVRQVAKENNKLYLSTSMYCQNIVEGSYCWSEKLYLIADLVKNGVSEISSKEFFPAIEKLLELINRIKVSYKEIWNLSLDNTSDKIPLLQEIIEEHEKNLENEKQAAAVEPENGTSAIVTDYDSVKEELKNSSMKIIHFANVPKELHDKITEQLNQLNNVPNPIDSDPDLRKIRRGFTKAYWEVYREAAKKFISTKKHPPLAVDLMFKYGFFDERFLTEEIIGFLGTYRDRTSSKYPYFKATDFLEQIYKNEKITSIDELGQTFIDHMREKHSEPRWRREKDLPPEVNTGENRLEFEIDKQISVNSRLCSGVFSSYFPILVKEQFVLEVEKMIVSQKKLTDAVDKLLKIDYSLFYREVLFTDENANIYKEFVQTEVAPNFIIVPSIGPKVMMWMDFESRSKQSAGRIMLPAFATADLFTMLVEAMGAFRWELCKTIQGVDWNNVSQASITADYMDYIQFFKKRQELSLEQKEKIRTELKKFRTDRDKFINDYKRWIKYEAEGVPKLNKVTRNIFYRHAPFSKDIRKELSTTPAFTDIAHRFANIRRRKLKELETRYKKYQKDGRVLPQLLQDNLEFYSI